MPVTINGCSPNDDAEYQLWLRDPAADVCHLVEMEFGPRSAFMSAGTTTQVLLSDKPFVGAIPAVVSIPSLRREIGGSRVTAAVGDLVLSNGLGVAPFDGGVFTKNIDGRPVRIYHGDVTWPRWRFRQIADYVAQTVKSNTTAEIVIGVAGRDILSNQPIQGSTITVGPNANRPKPLCYGECFNVSPIVKDAAGSIYQYHDGASYDVSEVRDAGLPFETETFTIASVDAGTDTITTVAAHGLTEDARVIFAGSLPSPLVAGTEYWVAASGLGVDTIKVSATMGGAVVDLTTTTAGGTGTGYYWTADLSTSRLLLSALPVGQITADAHGDATGGLYVDDVCSIAERVIGQCDVDARRRAALLAALNVGEVQRHGVYIAERRNKLDVLDGMFAGVGAWYGFGRTGSLMYGRLLDESPDVWYIGDDDLVADITVGTFDVPRAGHRVIYQRNWTQQQAGTLSATVSDTDKALYANNGSVAESSGGYGSGNSYFAKPPYPPGFDATAVDHTLAYIPADVVSTLANEAAAENVARYLNLTKCAWLVPVTIPLGRIGFQMEIGDTIYLDSAFIGVGGYGYARGSIKAIEDQPSEGRATVTALFLLPHDNG